MFHCLFRARKREAIDRRIGVVHRTNCRLQTGLAAAVPGLAKEQDGTAIGWRLIAQEMDAEGESVERSSARVARWKLRDRVRGCVRIAGEVLHQARLTVKAN